MQNEACDRVKKALQFVDDKGIDYIELKCFFNSARIKYTPLGWLLKVESPDVCVTYYDIDKEDQFRKLKFEDDVILSLYIATKNTEKQLDRYYKSMIKKNIRVERRKEFVNKLAMRLFK